MSLVESPVETVVKFISSWRYSHPKRLSEEIRSVFNETNRHPDPFKLVYRDEKILNFETKEPVNINRSSYVGQKEGEFFDALTDWLGQNNEGSAVWISPLFPGLYPANKITVYQIISTENEEKITFNTSIILDTKVDHTLEIASRINPVFLNCSNPEVLRNKLFAVDENFDLLDLFKLASNNSGRSQSPGQETIKGFAELIQSGFDPRFIAEKMYKKGVIGDHAVSCVSLKQNTIPTFGVFMDKNSFVMKFGGGESGKYVKNCGACGTKIEAKISKGYKCAKCGGVYEGC